MRRTLPPMIVRIFDIMTLGAFKTNRLGRPEFPEVLDAARRNLETDRFDRRPPSQRPPADPNLFEPPLDPGGADSRRPPDTFPPWSMT